MFTKIVKVYLDQPVGTFHRLVPDHEAEANHRRARENAERESQNRLSAQRRQNNENTPLNQPQYDAHAAKMRAEQDAEWSSRLFATLENNRRIAQEAIDNAPQIRAAQEARDKARFDSMSNKWDKLAEQSVRRQLQLVDNFFKTALSAPSKGATRLTRIVELQRIHKLFKATCGIGDPARLLKYYNVEASLRHHEKAIDAALSIDEEPGFFDSFNCFCFFQPDELKHASLRKLKNDIKSEIVENVKEQNKVYRI